MERKEKENTPVRRMLCRCSAVQHLPIGLSSYISIVSLTQSHRRMLEVLQSVRSKFKQHQSVIRDPWNGN